LDDRDLENIKSSTTMYLFTTLCKNRDGGNVMKYLASLFGIILITSCATYSPEQLQAKASDKTDVQLCFDMVLPNPNQYSKQELMNRGVNCNDHAETVIEMRRKQIQQAQMLMAFGNAMKGQPVMSNIPTMGTLPNYSNQDESLPLGGQNITYFKESESVAGFNKICVYAFGATKVTRTIPATSLCPLSVT